MNGGWALGPSHRLTIMSYRSHALRFFRARPVFHKHDFPLTHQSMAKVKLHCSSAGCLRRV